MNELRYEVGKFCLDFSKLSFLALIVSQNLQGWHVSWEVNLSILAVSVVSFIFGCHAIYAHGKYLQNKERLAQRKQQKRK